MVGTILLVDDDEMNGSFFSSRLKNKGFKVDFVKNHQDCFKALLDNDYDLVLLDIMMPEVSGIEILKKIREKKNNLELPVIMVTAKDEALDIVDALKLGANDYLVKPVSLEIAIARINTQIYLKQLIRESLKAKQVNTINTMVVTLNHEINNPLAIAMGHLNLPYEKLDEIRVEKSKQALTRIAEIVKRIDTITGGDIEEVDYTDSIKMYKLK